MICKNCGEELRDDELFCHRCGTKAVREFFCPNCGQKLREGAAFCSACGTACGAGQSGANTAAAGGPAAGQGDANNAAGEKPEPKPQSGPPSDKWAWSLATAPLGVSLFLGALGVNEWLVMIPVIILNCIFITQDKKELESHEMFPGNWVWLGFILVPVYLFIRAARTNKKYGYAIVWCVLCVLDILI